MTRISLHPFERFDQDLTTPGRSQVLVRLSYDGSYFHGVPPQPGLPSVSSALQNRLLHLFGQPLKALIFTARTDKGVFATVNFATGWLKDGPTLPPQGLHLCAGNDGLGAIDIIRVSQDVFARTIAQSKTYAYRFRDDFLSVSKDSIPYWDILPKMRLELMQEAASYLVGTHNFESFQVRSGKESRNTRCTIDSATIESTLIDGHNEIHFTIRGSSFLRRMVRTLAGTLAEIGCGLMPPSAMQTFLTSPSAPWIGPTAPARGLTLQKIELVEHLRCVFD